MILHALLLVLEWNRSGRDGRSQPMAFSADRMICCSLPLSLAVEAANQTVIDEVGMDSMMAEDGLLMGNLKAKRVANNIPINHTNEKFN